MARLDTKQVADRLGISYVVAAGLVKYLVANGQATLVEKRKNEKTEKNPAGLGKPTRIYEFSDAVTLDLSESVAVVETVETVAEDVVDETVTEVSEAA